MNPRLSVLYKISGHAGAYVWLFVLLCFGQTAIAQSPKKKAVVGKPSLDSLVARVDSYWSLLLMRKKIQAAEYVDPSGREKFVELGIPEFSDPRLKSLELSAERNEATVVVKVKRTFPIGTFDWPVTERWAFKSGKWYLQLDPARTPFSDDKRQSIQAEQEEAKKRALRGMLQFEPEVLDFGMVRQGEPVSLSLKYSLAGSDAFLAKIEKSAPELQIQGLSTPRLSAGKLQELATVIMPTRGHDGIVFEYIVVKVQRENVEVEFKIPIQGYIFVPVSITPKHLQLNSGSEAREKVITVRNKSKSALELQSFFSSPTGAIEVAPIPVTIPAGQQLPLKVRQVREAGKPNTPELLTIAFAQPIEDISSLTVGVILDAVEKKDELTYDPAKDPQLQEQIRKNLMNVPNR